MIPLLFSYCLRSLYLASNNNRCDVKVRAARGRCENIGRKIRVQVASNSSSFAWTLNRRSFSRLLKSQLAEPTRIVGVVITSLLNSSVFSFRVVERSAAGPAFAASHLCVRFRLRSFPHLLPSTCRFYSSKKKKSHRMPPKKAQVQEKVLLGRPGNNLKSGIVCEQRPHPFFGFLFWFGFFSGIAQSTFLLPHKTI